MLGMGDFLLNAFKRCGALVYYQTIELATDGGRLTANDTPDDNIRRLDRVGQTRMDHDAVHDQVG